MKYTLVVECEHDEHPALYVPMTLNGSESVDAALERFRDALVVAAHMFAERHAEPVLCMDRIDGVASEESKKRLAELEASGVL